MTEEEEKLKELLDSIEPPEPEIVYEGFFGNKWFPSMSAFEKSRSMSIFEKGRTLMRKLKRG